MISVLLNNVKNDRETVHDALNSLLSRCGTDEKVIVKTYALRGLANLTKHPKDIVSSTCSIANSNLDAQVCYSSYCCIKFLLGRCR